MPCPKLTSWTPPKAPPKAFPVSAHGNAIFPVVQARALESSLTPVCLSVCLSPGPVQQETLLVQPHNTQVTIPPASPAATTRPRFQDCQTLPTVALSSPKPCCKLVCNNGQAVFSHTACQTRPLHCLLPSLRVVKAQILTMTPRHPTPWPAVSRSPSPLSLSLPHSLHSSHSRSSHHCSNTRGTLPCLAPCTGCSFGLEFCENLRELTA